MDVRLLVVAYLMICILPVVPSPYRSRSRNRNSSPTYDQKQTGEYNIQLHLKDFEVVALLSDGAFGDLGEYDYNYDYSELTVKPGIFGSTSKPPTKPSTKPESTTTSPTTAVTTQEHVHSTTQQQFTTLHTTQTTKKVHIEQQTSKLTTTDKTTVLPTVTSTSTLPTIKHENDLEANITKDESSKNSENGVKPVESLTIVDAEQINQEEQVPLVIHRKCSTGFTRDKLGRCRRVRRPPPQFSFGISRLANLASKLRQGTNDSQTSENLSIEEN